jgi:hypothetical protein
MRSIRAEIKRLAGMAEDELYVAAEELQAPYELVKDSGVRNERGQDPVAAAVELLQQDQVFQGKDAPHPVAVGAAVWGRWPSVGRLGGVDSDAPIVVNGPVSSPGAAQVTGSATPASGVCDRCTTARGRP